MRIHFTLAALFLCAACGDPNPAAPEKTGGIADKARQHDERASRGASPAPSSQAIAGTVISTESHIAQIEDKIGFSLPETYRKFLLDHAADIARRKASRKQDDYSVFPYSTVSEVVRNNTGDMSFLVIDGETEPIADKIVCISDNGGGDYHFIYRDPTSAGVWYWHNETQKVTKDYQDLDEYFSKLGH